MYILLVLRRKLSIRIRWKRWHIIVCLIYINNNLEKQSFVKKPLLPNNVTHVKLRLLMSS